MTVKEEQDCIPFFRAFVQALYENGYITEVEFDDLYYQMPHPREDMENGYLLLHSIKERNIEVSLTSPRDEAGWDGIDAYIVDRVSNTGLCVKWMFGTDFFNISYSEKITPPVVTPPRGCYVATPVVN